MQKQTARLTTIKLGARVLNVSPYALYRKVQTGDLPSYRFGRKVLIDVAEVLSAMRQPLAKESEGELERGVLT